MIQSIFQFLQINFLCLDDNLEIDVSILRQFDSRDTFLQNKNLNSYSKTRNNLVSSIFIRKSNNLNYFSSQRIELFDLFWMTQN